MLLPFLPTVYKLNTSSGDIVVKRYFVSTYLYRHTDRQKGRQPGTDADAYIETDADRAGR